MAHGNPRVGCHHQSRWCQQWVSSPTMLLCDAPAGCCSSLTLELRVKPHLSPSVSSASPERTGTKREHTALPRDGTAQLRSAQCIGTRSHSSSHTHSHTHTLPLSPSLSRSLLPPLLMPMLLLLELLLNYFLPSSLWVSEGIQSSVLCLLLRALHGGADER